MAGRGAGRGRERREKNEEGGRKEWGGASSSFMFRGPRYLNTARHISTTIKHEIKKSYCHTLANLIYS